MIVWFRPKPQTAAWVEFASGSFPGQSPTVPNPRPVSSFSTSRLIQARLVQPGCTIELRAHPHWALSPTQVLSSIPPPSIPFSPVVAGAHGSTWNSKPSACILGSASPETRQETSVFQPPLLSCPYFAWVSSKTDDGCHARPRPLFQGGDLVDFGQDEHGPFAIRLTEHGWKPCDVNALAPAKTFGWSVWFIAKGAWKPRTLFRRKGLQTLDCYPPGRWVYPTLYEFDGPLAFQVLIVFHREGDIVLQVLKFVGFHGTSEFARRGRDSGARVRRNFPLLP